MLQGKSTLVTGSTSAIGAGTANAPAGHGGAQQWRSRDRASRAHRDARALNPRKVKISGVLVDCVVVDQAEHHEQTFGTFYSAA